MVEEELQNAARKIRERALLAKDRPVDLLPDEVCNDIGDCVEWSKVTRTKNREEFHENAILIEAWLRFAESQGRDTPSPEELDRVGEWVLMNILPPSSFAHRSSYDSAPPPLITSNKTFQWRALSTVGIRLLLHVQRLSNPTKSGDLSIDLLACLAAYTDSRDPWTTPEASKEAEELLQSLLSGARRDVESRALGKILIESVKPRFVKSQNPAVTEQGRKAIYPLPQPLDMSDMETASKPWKFRDIYIVTVYRWVLTRLDSTGLEQHWPQLIPPLLAIVDDEITALKVRGCELLDILMKVTPTDFLKRTGLGEVFEASLIPYLSYLPTLTPEDESISLLDAVYPTLLLLAQTRFPGEADVFQRQKALDKIMRMGILKGYWHVSENVKIAEMLVRRMADVIAVMKILCVKHLKDLLPLLTSILSAPFCLSYPPLLHAAANSLRILTLNAWPRINRHRAEALKGLCLCWCKLERDPKPLKPELSAVANDLVECLKVLEAAFKATGVDVAHEFELLRASNAYLETFFPAQEPTISELTVTN